jgi:preprotein translocase subunit SecF
MKPVYKIFFVVSMLLMVASIVALAMYGLRFGVDFKGGSVMELSFTGTTPAIDDIRAMATATKGIEGPTVSATGEHGLIIRSNVLSEDTHQTLLTTIQKKYPHATEDSFNSIGPSIGSELKQKSLTAIIVVLFAIVIYLSFVFRAMSRVLPPVALGLAGIFALIHDLLIPLGVFAILSHLGVVEISAVFVAAALTILGYSISDTVVVFDRVRENVIRFGSKESFPNLVHKSVMQTLTRSINTSMTTLLALVAIFFFGGESVKYFALALIIGVISGTYSSIFVAAPILVWWSEFRRRKAA